MVLVRGQHHLAGPQTLRPRQWSCPTYSCVPTTSQVQQYSRLRLALECGGLRSSLSVDSGGLLLSVTQQATAATALPR
jgi:hypothetical protein